jgi:CDP-glucose 4,6-dehydratase
VEFGERSLAGVEMSRTALSASTQPDGIVRARLDGIASARPDAVAPARPDGMVDPGFWRDRRVLLTGHTGFKGAWMALWLQTLGARLTGFSLGVPTEPSLYELAHVGEGMESIEGDVRDFQALAAAIDHARPEVVIHMAAQSLVRRSFAEPRLTYEVNVMGTVNLLDALRGDGNVRAVVNVTSDKCYENHEWAWAYREYEPMGGHDPYSSSKGCAELVTDAFRRSYFGADGTPRVASARAGNVIGGGDWSGDRLIPDLMRAALAGRTVHVRNPDSIRPWQHVLNPLSGYLTLAQALWSSGRLASGWNFGPVEEDARPVRWIVERVAALWPEHLLWVEDARPEDAEPDRPRLHEARCLKLDSSLARTHLGWRPRWGLAEGLRGVVDWYDALNRKEDMRAVTLRQIERFITLGVPPGR